MRVASSLLILFALTATQVFSAPLTIFTEELRPYAYNDHGTLVGSSIEVVRQIQILVGDQSAVQVVPWARGYALAQTRADVVLFTMARTPARERSFFWVGPIATDGTYLYQAKRRPLPIRSLDDAKSYTVLATRSYPEIALLQAQGFRNIYQTSEPEINWKMLASGRGDLTASGTNTAKFEWENAGLDPSLFERVGPELFRTDLYIAFSIQTAPSVVRRWRAALNELRRNGQIAKIQRQWGLEPTP